MPGVADPLITPVAHIQQVNDAKELFATGSVTDTVLENRPAAQARSSRRVANGGVSDPGI